MVSLNIVYQNDAGKAISAARVSNQLLLIQVAKKAIKEARDRAKSLMKVNPLIGKFQRQEAERLEKFLVVLIPELDQGKRVMGNAQK